MKDFRDFVHVFHLKFLFLDLFSRPSWIVDFSSSTRSFQKPYDPSNTQGRKNLKVFWGGEILSYITRSELFISFWWRIHSVTTNNFTCEVETVFCEYLEFSGSWIRIEITVLTIQLADIFRGLRSVSAFYREFL